MTDTESKIYIAVITTLLAQIIIIIIGESRKRRDKNLKKKLIIQDLQRQKIILSRLRAHYITLSLKYRKDELDNYISDAFQDFHSDVFNSIVKTELYLIFKEDLPDVIGIYKVLEFLKERTPHNIYTKNLTMWDKHKNSASHLKHIETNPMCEIYNQLIVIAKDSIILHLNTVKSVTKDIEKILSKYE